MAAGGNEHGTTKRMGSLERQVHQYHNPCQLGNRERHKTATPIQKTNEVPRNPNGTYQPRTTTQGGEAMDLDAFRRRPRLNLSPEEFRRRMRERLCLKCAQPGHRAEACTRQDQSKQFNPQTSSWQPARRKAPWQPRQKIQEMEVEKQPEQSGNEESPQ